MGNLQLNLLTFPLWWYTTGFNILWDWNKRQYYLGLYQTGITLFARHMREPLYGDYTKQGRLLSFIIRLVMLALKFLVLIFRVIFLFAVDLGYLIILPAILTMIIFQLIPLAS